MKRPFGESRRLHTKGSHVASNLLSFERFVRAVRGGMMGVAVGDALGVPVEKHTHDEIMALTEGRGVTDYLDPRHSRFDDMHGLPRGSYSDDTQLTLMTARSLIERGGYDVRHQGLALAREIDRSKHGWGGTTVAAAKAIRLWAESGGIAGRAPDRPAPTGTKGFGQGSGPAMKIFPLAAWELFDGGKYGDGSLFLDRAVELGRMTHGDIRAVMASVSLGYAAGAFAQFDERAYDDANAAFAHAHRQRELAGRITGYVLEKTVEAERRYEHVPGETPRFSDRLQEAIAWRDFPAELRTRINTGFKATESVPFAIVTACRHPNDFRAAVLEAVNAGQDTDTVASMVGALVGCRVGLEGIPPEWQSGLRNAEAVIRTADELCAAAYGYDPRRRATLIPPWTRPA